MPELSKDRGRDLAPRLHALERAVDASRGMMPADVVERASAVRVNAGERLARGDAAIVVALAGGTGSGKSTSLAGLLREFNESQSIHVVTLEDPVEFVHPNMKATFNQRELGSDFDTFANGLRAALRQAPKVILVGEMRDRETVELGLKASETGHLVLSTLHTVDAGQTINRIVGMFDQSEEKQIRQRLASTIRWIVSQRLLPKVGGGRLAIHDILGNNIRAKESILNGESDGKTFYEIQEASEPFGMQTFDQAIIKAFNEGQVTAETAEMYATRKAIVQRGIDRVKQTRGEQDQGITGLTIDKEYGSGKYPKLGK